MSISSVILSLGKSRRGVVERKQIPPFIDS